MSEQVALVPVPLRPAAHKPAPVRAMTTSIRVRLQSVPLDAPAILFQRPEAEQQLTSQQVTQGTHRMGTVLAVPKMLSSRNLLDKLAQQRLTHQEDKEPTWNWYFPEDSSSLLTSVKSVKGEGNILDHPLRRDPRKSSWFDSAVSHTCTAPRQRDRITELLVTPPARSARTATRR